MDEKNLDKGTYKFVRIWALSRGNQQKPVRFILRDHGGRKIQICKFHDPILIVKIGGI